jgi:sugar phosphate isomerase/epimerase
MLLGTHSHLFRGSPAAAAAAMRRLGLNCVQLTPSFPGLRFHELAHFSSERCRAVAEPFQSAGLRIACLSGAADLMDPNLDRRHRGILRLHALVRHCRDFGTDCIVTETGSLHPKGAWTAPPLARSREAWAELLLILGETLRVAAEHNVRLLLKPGPGQVLASIEDALRLRYELPHHCLGFVMDPANFLLESRPETLAEDLDRLVRCMGRWTPVIHAKDLRFTATGTATPRVGRGVLSYGRLLCGLREVQPETPIILEHLRPEEVTEARACMERFTT